MLDRRPRGAARHGKRQWHTNVWSIAGPDVTTTTSTSKGGGKTVYVTKIIGTTTVPPEPSTTTSTTSTSTTVKTTPSSTTSSSSSTTSSPQTSTSTTKLATTLLAQTTSLIAAVTITSLPSGFVQGSSAVSSASASASASASGAALANTAKTGTGMSSGGVLGTVVGVLAAIVVLLGIAGCLYRRRTNNQRFGSKRNPFASDKGYRNSATRLTDKSGPAYSGAGGGGGYRDDPFDDRAAADAYPLDAMSEKTAPFFPAAYGSGIGRAPSIASGPGMAGRGAAGGYAAFGAPDGAYAGGAIAPVVVQHASGTGLATVPAIAVTHANAPRTRDLTNVGPYARSERAFVQDLPSAQAYAQRPYRDDWDHGHDLLDARPPSPTDYYGQSMTPQSTDAFINERYAEDPRAPPDNPFLIGDDEQEQLDDQTNQQQRSGTKTPRQSMPQLPPLSPGVFDSPLTSNFAAFASRPGSQVQPLPNALEPPSRSPSQKRSADELKRGYADLAKAAQIDEPVTPVNAATQSRPIVPAGQPNLMPPVERYQHGRPLSPLDEVETPVATPSTGGQPAYYFDNAVSTPANRPYTPENRVYGTAHGSPGSGSLPPHSGIPPSVAFPPPSPGVSLPESPSGSFLGHGGSSVDRTPPRRPFRGADAQSTVSLDAAYADAPSSGYRFSAGAWDSPASTRTMPQQSGLPNPMQPVKYGYAVQQGASRRSIGPEDAYGGI